MNLRLHFDACLYRGRWAVLCYAINTYSFIGAGRRFCERKALELNAQAERERWPKPVLHALCRD